MVEGVFGRVFRFKRGADVVVDLEVGTDLITLGFLLGEARESIKGRQARCLAVAADVPGTAGTGVADALTEVGQTRGRAIEPVGVGRIDVEAVTGCGEAAAGRDRDVGIRGRAGALHVGQGRGTPLRAVQTTGVVELCLVDEAVGRTTDGRVGRVGVDAQGDAAACDPVDLVGADRVGLFIFAEGIEVQAIVQQVDTAQHGDAAGRGVATLDQFTVVGVDLETFVVLAQGVVDHARNGVGTVNGRGTTGDDFDVLDQQARNGRHVNRQVTRRRTDVTTTVNQRQRTA